MTAPALSVVIPALNEAGTIGGILGDLSGLGVAHEVIVADGGSRDGTVSIARDAGAVVVESGRGRGRQLRAGLEVARAGMFCVLHADVRLPVETLGAVDLLAAGRARGAYAFRLRIDRAGMAYRIVEAGANLRSRLLGLPYGDQGLVVDRDTYDAAGGFADVPLMEDVMLARAFHASGVLHLRPEHVVVSARRWQRDGVVRRTLSNMAILGRFLAGESPHDLAARYAPQASRS